MTLQLSRTGTGWSRTYAAEDLGGSGFLLSVSNDDANILFLRWRGGWGGESASPFGFLPSQYLQPPQAAADVFSRTSWGNHLDVLLQQLPPQVSARLDTRARADIYQAYRPQPVLQALRSC